MQIEFTAHNIRLDDGTFTKPELGIPMDEVPWFVSARRVLQTVFPGDKSRCRVADLGCLEGGYAIEFARLGFQVLGVEVRALNYAACEYVKQRIDLPNVRFVRDDAWNIHNYGVFDATFCCGLLYHLDRPKLFIDLLSRVTSKLVILQTHFAQPDGVGEPSGVSKFRLSPLTEHEALRGRWFTEFADESAFQDRENAKWQSWDNRKSFWLTRESVVQALSDAGFDLVAEQFDSLGPTVADAMANGFYKTDSRSTFIGVKT